MPTKSVSTQQAKQVIDGTHFLQVSSGPVVIFDIEGEVNSTAGTNYYIQLLSVPQATAVSGTTIPLYSRQVVQANAATQINGFSFTYRPIGIDTAQIVNPSGGTLATTGANTLPVYVAISSTDGVWTQVAASTNVTIDFELSRPEFVAETLAGDLTTNVQLLSVWASGGTAAARRLVGLNITETSGVASYVQVFASATLAGIVTLTPVLQIPLAANATINARFGGLAVLQGNPTTFVESNGCYVVLSHTSGSNDGAGQGTIQAIYI